MLLLGYTFKRAMVDPLIRHGVIRLVIATLDCPSALKQAHQGRRDGAGNAVQQPLSRRLAGIG